MTAMQQWIIAGAVVLLAAIYGVPYLLSLRSKSDAKWPATKSPPKGTIEYIAEMRARMSGVRYVEILEALEVGETPDEVSQRAARAFHDMYMTGAKLKEGEAAQ